MPSEFNPTESISRGSRATELVKKHEWFVGSSFLQRPLEDWPKQFQGKTKDDKELLRSFKSQGKCNVSLLAWGSEGDGVHWLTEYFSSYHRLKVATAWFVRVRDCLWERLKDSDAKLNISAPSLLELKRAELNLNRYVQRSFSKTLRSCASRRKQHK